jgi:hypothetical protein
MKPNLRHGVSFEDKEKGAFVRVASKYGSPPTKNFDAAINRRENWIEDTAEQYVRTDGVSSTAALNLAAADARAREARERALSPNRRLDVAWEVNGSPDMILDKYNSLLAKEAIEAARAAGPSRLSRLGRDQAILAGIDETLLLASQQEAEELDQVLAEAMMGMSGNVDL